MEGIWLLLVFIVALASICVLAGMRPGITKSRHCPSCETPMSLRRVHWLKSHMFLGRGSVRIAVIGVGHGRQRRRRCLKEEIWGFGNQNMASDGTLTAPPLDPDRLSLGRKLSSAKLGHLG